jgi:hypothetical protein
MPCEGEVVGAAGGGSSSAHRTLGQQRWMATQFDPKTKKNEIFCSIIHDFGGKTTHLSSFFTKPQEGPKSKQSSRNMPQMMYLTNA